MKYIVNYHSMKDCEYSSGVKSSIFKDGGYQKPPSQSWGCPACGRCYLRVVVCDNQIVNPYIFLCNLCEDCGENDILLAKTRLTLPGSILMEGYNTIDELSEEMLRRELLLELKAMKLLIDKGVL